MLVFAAFVPHPLIAIPDVGREHAAKIRKTLRAYRELAGELYAVHPDSVIIISPHHGMQATFNINQRPEVQIDFGKYGNLSDRETLVNDIGTGYALKESLEPELVLMATDETVLDYGSAIPLWHLLPRKRSGGGKVIPIGISGDAPEEHYRVGVRINRFIHRTAARIAVIASGDLAHGVRRSGPGTYNPKAADFNRNVQQALEARDLKKLFVLHEGLGKNEVVECGTRVLALLLGILETRAYTTRIMSSETALNVGYLSAQFVLK